jgi:RHS repeat-associated protein
VTLTDATGSTSVYTAPTSTIYPRIYTAVGDASDGSVFTQTAATTFTLADTDGAVTSWSSTGASSVNRISGVTLPGVGGPSYLYSGSQLVSVTAQAPPGLSCATPLVTVGCRSLTFLYGAPSSSDPSLTEPAGMVDAAGLLAEIDAVIPDPASNTEITVPVARYGYDSNSLTAHLLGEWDPRIPSGKLVTNYSYDTAGRLASVTPPGLNGWNLHYDDVNLGGRLGSVTRTDPANGTATTTIAYGVALSGSGLPTLDATTVGTWNQTDLPVTGTAVFSPDHPLTVAPTSSDWPYANLSFLDVNGREVNTASYGAGAWQIDTTNYDPFGNPVSTLTADNRNQALTPVAGTTDPAVAAILTPAATASAARAQALSTISTYTADGAELVDSYGPTHPVLLADNVTKIDARSHSHQVYDENHPAGGPFDLVTTSTSSAQSLDLVDHDTHTTISGYNPLVTGDGNGWTLRTPTTVTTVVPGGPNNTRSTRFDTSGRTVETRLPAGTADATGAGNDARSTLTSYYTATGTGPCVSAIYAGQPCQTQAAAAATGSQPVLTVSTVTGYNRWLAPQASTETGAAGALLRSSSTTFDAAGRPIVSHQATTTNVTGGGTSTSQLPDTTDVYDPNTGLPTATTQNGGTVALTTGYDALGRAVSYTDSTGNATTTAYDIDGRPITRTDGKGTYGYSYDNGGGSSSNEHRGLLTSLDTGITAAGYTNHPYVATYDAAGRAVKTTLPNLDLANATFDNAGQQTSLAYTGVGLGDTLSFTANYDSLGRKATLGGPVSTKTFTYAPVGELATSSINTAGACVSKSYSYDPNSNRTGYATNSTCTPSTGTLPLVHSYDSADRLIDPGTSYDQLGRTGTAPAATITGGADATLQYFDNDMVQKQTQGGHTQTFTLDPSQHRILTQADSASGTSTNYYADSSDSPAWTANPTGYTRNIDGLSGLGAIQAHTTSTGTDTIALQVSDLQGNVVTTVDDTPNAIVNGCADYDPFGASIATTTAPTRYGWLGGHQRATDDLAGLTLMGYRLYNPLTGRFLQTDPIPGGSANSYDYADQDPVNQIDLSGRSLSGDGGRSYQPLSKTTIRQMLRTLGAVGCHGTKTITCTVLLGASDEDKDAINRGAEKFFNNLTGGYGLKPSEKRHGMTRALNGDGYFGAGRYQLRGWAKTSLYATMEIHLDSGQKIKIHFQGTHDLCACDGPEMFGLFE